MSGQYLSVTVNSDIDTVISIECFNGFYSIYGWKQARYVPVVEGFFIFVHVILFNNSSPNLHTVYKLVTIK